MLCPFQQIHGLKREKLYFFFSNKYFYLPYFGHIIQDETELSFGLIPSLAKITSSLTVSVWGFVWDWVKECMSLKDYSNSPCIVYTIRYSLVSEGKGTFRVVLLHLISGMVLYTSTLPRALGFRILDMRWLPHGLHLRAPSSCRSRPRANLNKCIYVTIA